MRRRTLPGAQLAPQPLARFGNINSDGTPLAGYSFDFPGVSTFWNRTSVVPFTCPGTGQRTLSSLEVYAKTRGSPHGNVRMALFRFDIYTGTNILICQWNAEVLVNSATEQWWGGSTPLTGTTTLTGGLKYLIVVSTDSASGLVNLGYTSLTNASDSNSTDYTNSGFADGLSGSGSTMRVAVRATVQAGGGSPPYAPIIEIEEYYVDTDYTGSTVNGGPTTPYKNLQTCLNARINKTLTLPVYIYCSGATADTMAVTDFSLNSFTPSASNQLYIIGNRTARTWDNSKYHITPSNRTSYHGAINFNKSYIHLDKIQCEITSTDVGFSNELCYFSNTNPGTVTFSNGICRLPGSANAERYFSSADGTGGITVWNTLGYGMGSNNTSNGVKNHGTSYIYNCTFICNAGNGIDNTVNSNITVKNCYIQSTNATFAWVNIAPTIITTATSDSMGTSGMRNVSYTTANFTNVTTNFEDLKPVGAALIGTGTSTSGDTAPLNYDSDMTGVAMANPPDIGPIKA